MPKRIQPGERAPSKVDELLSGGGYHPLPRTSSVRNVIPAQVTTMITAPGRRR
jgi:hypothetical protein